MIELFFVLVSTAPISLYNYGTLDVACKVAKEAPTARVYKMTFGESPANIKIKCKHVEATKAHWEEDKETGAALYISTSAIKTYRFSPGQNLFLNSVSTVGHVEWITTP